MSQEVPFLQFFFIEPINSKFDICFSCGGGNQLAVRVGKSLGHVPSGSLLRFAVAQIPYNCARPLSTEVQVNSGEKMFKAPAVYKVLLG